MVQQVAAIGIDAAEWPELVRLMGSGRLPNLARLRHDAIEVPLENTISNRPEEAWTTFVYGDAAHQAGHWSSLTFDPVAYRPYRRGTFLGRPVLSDASDRPLWFDVPKHAITPDGPGTQVTGWGAHAPSFPRGSRPAGLLTELDRRFGAHPALNEDFQNAWYQPDYLEGLSQRLVEGARIRGAATRWLLEEHAGWDLFVTAMSETHSGGHHLWHGVDPSHRLAHTATAGTAGRLMGEVHEAIDAALGVMLQALPRDATVVVFAVHGMQANNSDVAAFLLLPELLHRLDGRPPRLVGPDQARWAAEGHPPIVPDRRRRPMAFALDHFDDDRLKRMRRRITTGPLMDVERAWRRRTGRPPGNRRAWRTPDDVPPEADLSNPDAARFEEGAEDFANLWYRDQWPTMRAFALPSFGEGRVRINLEGREAHGVVPADRYAATCQEIETVLRETTDPRTGGPVVQEVTWERRHDPLDPSAPDADLIVQWSAGVDAFSHPVLGPIGPMPALRTGEHSNHGFALVAGPHVERAVLPTQPALALPTLIGGLLSSEEAPSGASVARAFAG